MPRDPMPALLRAIHEHRGAARRSVAIADALLLIEPGPPRVRAARTLLRGSAIDGSAWRLASACLEAGDDALTVLRAQLEDAGEAVARAASWLRIPRKPVVATFGASRTVMAALRRLEPSEIRCFESGPDRTGSRFAARLRRHGLPARGFPDLALRRSLADCDLAVLGARAIGPRVATALGGHAFAILSSDARVPCYLLADETKGLPEHVVSRAVPPGESFPAGALTAVLTERGPMSVAALRRTASTQIPPSLWRAAGFSGEPTTPG